MAIPKPHEERAAGRSDQRPRHERSEHQSRPFFHDHQHGLDDSAADAELVASGRAVRRPGAAQSDLGSYDRSSFRETWRAIQRVSATRAFKVPANADHLDVAIAFQSPLSTTNPPLVFLGLVDPSGRQAALSDPQDLPGTSSGFGHVDVVRPPSGHLDCVDVHHRKAGVAGSCSGPGPAPLGPRSVSSRWARSRRRIVLAPGASQDW